MFLKSMYGIGSDNGPSGSSNELINKPEKKPQKRDRSGFCKECNKQYSNFGKHWKTIHEKKRYGRGFCDICQKSFEVKFSFGQTLNDILSLSLKPSKS